MIILRTDNIKQEHIFDICDCDGKNQEHWITTYSREVSIGIYNEKLNIYANGHILSINNKSGKIDIYSRFAETIKNKLKNMNPLDREEYTKILSPEANSLLSKLE